ncbi:MULTISPECIES: hypothetical protein [Streptomyces]|uniref:hypothetical protein n=1 Tax=Streptomyces TaxID=1883 RepID=UPI0031E1AF4E
MSSTGLRFNVAYGSWELIWSHVHRVLVVNLGVAAANLPLLVALQLSHTPWRHPVVFVPLLLALPGPSIAAAFGYLAAAGADGGAPVRLYVQEYRRLYGRALRASAPFLLATVAAVTDLVALRTSGWGTAVVQMAAVVAVLAASSWVVALALVAADASRAGLRGLLLAPYAVVRHGWLAVMNLVVAAATLLLVNQAPLLGLAVLPGCALFVLWRNCGHMTAFERAGTDSFGETDIHAIAR